MWWSNVRICTEINVKESSLSALEHDCLSCLVSLESENGNIVHVREKSLAVLCIFLCYSVKVERLAAVNLCDYSILELACCLDFFSQYLRVYEIVHSDSAALVFIHICRTYASLCSTDVLAASESLWKTVKSNVPRHYDVGTGVNFKVSLSLYASFSKAVKLADEVLRVKNYTCTDETESVRIENTRRDKVKFIDLAVVYNCMSCVVTALWTNNNICTGGDDVNYLTFTLVSPLSSYNNISRHFISSFHKYS